MNNKESQAGTKAEQRKNDEVLTSSPACTKPNVICSQSDNSIDLKVEKSNELFISTFDFQEFLKNQHKKEDSMLVFIGDNPPVNLFQDGVLKFYVTLDGQFSSLQIPAHEFAKEFVSLIQRFSHNQKTSSLYYEVDLSHLSK